MTEPEMQPPEVSEARRRADAAFQSLLGEALQFINGQNIENAVVNLFVQQQCALADIQGLVNVLRDRGLLTKDEIDVAFMKARDELAASIRKSRAQRSPILMAPHGKNGAQR